jgi:cerevisin
VASWANIFGIKTLDATGTGSINTTLAGLESAIQSHQIRSQQPGFVGSVITMSLSFIPTNVPKMGNTGQAMKLVISAANSAGIHITVAAGNDWGDACDASPAQLGGVLGPVITVGAMGMGNNSIAVFSNTGKCVDVYAPGERVVSAWMGSDVTINAEDGTSQATPHVAGIVATLMAKNQTLAQNPGLMKTTVQQMALRGVINGEAAQPGDRGLLANIGMN